MDLLEALRTRRSVRDFTGGPVAASHIDELIGAAALAPSAMNRQPWAFAVIEGAARLHDLAGEAKRHLLSVAPAGSALAEHLADPAFDLFYGAPALIVVCATDAGTQSFEDCALAADHIMLAAHARGLATCWIGLARSWLSLPVVKEQLGIPADLHPMAPLIIGHPRTIPPPTPRNPPRVVRCG